MGSITDFMVDPSFWVVALSAMAAFATVLTLALPLLKTDRLSNRLKLVSDRREELRQRQREQFAREKMQLRSGSPANFMKQTVEKLNLEQALSADAMRQKLVQAGLRGQGPLITLIFVRVTLPFVCLVASGVYLYFVNDHGYGGTTRLTIMLGVALIGFYAPDMFVSSMVSKRQNSIMMAFPDALDLLLICVEAGMSIEAAFNRVAKEIGGQSVELAEEIGLTTAELSYLQDRRQAYENLGTRTGLTGVKAVCTALIQAERYGTPLGQALRVMAEENRAMRMSAAEKKASALPAKLTVPMILFFLPPLFVVILGPAIMRAMESGM